MNHRGVGANGTGQIRSVAKALSLIELLAVEPQGLGLAEIARRLSFNESTTHHLLSTLRQRGFVEQDGQTKSYRFGYKLVGLVNHFLLDADLYTSGVGPLKDLRNTCGDTTYLNILQGRELVNVIELPGLRPIQVRHARRPGESYLHCTASGKLLMTYLPLEQQSALLGTLNLVAFMPNTLTSLEALRGEFETIRSQGYALDREESLDGLACVDAPVFARDGTCLASASVAYPATDPDRWRELVPQVTAAAAKISTALGFVPRAAALVAPGFGP